MMKKGGCVVRGRRVAAWAVAVVSAYALSGAAGAQAPASGGGAVVATVNGESITVENLRALVAQAQARSDGAIPFETMTPDGRAALLQDAVNQRVFALAARAVGLDARADVKFQVEQSTAEVLGRAYIQSKIHELTSDLAAARTYYDAHPAEFRVAPRVRGRHVLLATLEQAEQARAAILGGVPFEKVAAERSIDSMTRAKGGDLGWVARGVMVKVFEESIFALAVGQVSAPVRTSFGYHVIRVDERDDGVLPPFDAIQSDVVQAMVRRALDQLKADLSKKYGATIHHDVLTQFGR